MTAEYRRRYLVFLCQSTPSSGSGRPARTAAVDPKRTYMRIRIVPLRNRANGNCIIHGRLRMDGGRVEKRNGTIFGIDQQHDLGATKDDGLRAARDQTLNDLAICLAGGGGDMPLDQLIVDDAVDYFAVRFVGYDHVQTVLG